MGTKSHLLVLLFIVFDQRDAVYRLLWTRMALSMRVIGTTWSQQIWKN